MQPLSPQTNKAINLVLASLSRASSLAMLPVETGR